MIWHPRSFPRTSCQLFLISAHLLVFALLLQGCVSTPIILKNGAMARDGANNFFSGLEFQLENSLSKLKVYMLSVDVPLAEDVEMSLRDEDASYPEIVQKSISYPEIAAKSDTFWEFD